MKLSINKTGEHMNRYSFDEINIGLTESFKITITGEMMKKFMEITGDVNPLHTDKEYAGSKGFNKEVVYGMLTSSFLSTLAGVYLPGEHSLIQSVQVLMKKPVFIGDEITVTGEVTDKFPAGKRITLKVTILNQNAEKVLRGTMEIGVMDGVL